MEADSAAVLGLFAKRPVAGQVKTRLAAETSPEWAAQVASAFLLDTLDRIAQVPVRRVLAFAPAEAEGYFANLASGRFGLVPQAAGNLGERMESFIASQQRTGAETVVLIGTDSPTLPVAFIEQAFQELQRADVVLGPATDGGYYLLGCGQRLPPIFAGINWGTNQVLAETIAKLVSTWRLALLPPWYDVDTLAGWQMLQGHLSALRRSGIDPGLPHISCLQAP